MDEQNEKAVFYTIIMIIALAAVTSAQEVVYSPPSSLFLIGAHTDKVM